MHYHLEIIMPPSNDIERAVGEILSPFREGAEDGYHEFWDWYVIGGRWAGHKIETALGEERISAFHGELATKGITVSCFQAGKQTISPESQIPEVEEIWNRHFPESKCCPLFSNYGDQYKNNPHYPDVMLLKDTPMELQSERVIIADVNYDNTGMEAQYMVSNEFWNGVNYQKTAWDGEIVKAIEMYDRKKPTGDCLVVTIDYHS